jgi:hypothetical protein
VYQKRQESLEKRKDGKRRKRYETKEKGVEGEMGSGKQKRAVNLKQVGDVVFG